MNGILETLGIDPFYLFIAVFILLAVLIVLYVLLNERYRKLQRSYATFMKGKNAKNLEKSIFARFEELEEISALAKENREEINKIYKKMEGHYQKVGIVKYDAFHEMGGELSFALAMLDENDNGWIFNAMHSREGCYTYIKEIIKGESYIELAEEERKCLEKAIYQEEYDIKKGM
ncbi:MAG TPA: DUF4446 family protein [Candidatus Mediterraneibacter avicola]|nr:DUF4446 family protein [Candidatus Mediterraneibacter avicola]